MPIATKGHATTIAHACYCEASCGKHEVLAAASCIISGRSHQEVTGKSCARDLYNGGGGGGRGVIIGRVMNKWPKENSKWIGNKSCDINSNRLFMQW